MMQDCLKTTCGLFDPTETGNCFRDAPLWDCPEYKASMFAYNKGLQDAINVMLEIKGWGVSAEQIQAYFDKVRAKMVDLKGVE